MPTPPSLPNLPLAKPHHGMNSRALHRFLEILPGAVSWTLITFPIWATLFIPNGVYLVAYFILIFDIYWLYKSVTLAVTAVTSHIKIKSAENLDWLTAIKKLPEWEKVHHIILIPTYKEPLELLERTLTKLSLQEYPRERIAVVLAFEDREKEAPAKAETLKKRYGHVFGHFYATFHPDIDGEVKGKSSNEAWAGRHAKKWLIDEKKLDINYVTITSNDADAILHHKYLACLTHKFLTLPPNQRHFRFFQAAVMFYNNIWRVPPPVRVLNTISSIYQTAQQVDSDRLMNFSCYSTSLKMIDKVGYWDVDVIPEDYRIFFKSFFALNGKVKVEPLFLPVYADAAEADTFWSTMTNQYEQMKRWAWGTSDDAYVIKQWLFAPKVPFWIKSARVLRVVEDHFLWPVNWFIISIGANIPILLNKEFSQTVLGHNLPVFSAYILNVCILAFLVALVIDFRQRPKRPDDVSIVRKFVDVAEFALLPIVGFFFSALPGLDAHTRLMFGRYLEYRVTEKVYKE
jgi:cellulose synthase/poly-beta-1,6-N-acetylglucosamine synthase-like glycosyltransferase